MTISVGAHFSYNRGAALDAANPLALWVEHQNGGFEVSK